MSPFLARRTLAASSTFSPGERQRHLPGERRPPPAFTSPKPQTVSLAGIRVQASDRAARRDIHRRRPSSARDRSPVDAREALRVVAAPVAGCVVSRHRREQIQSPSKIAIPYSPSACRRCCYLLILPTDRGRRCWIVDTVTSNSTQAVLHLLLRLPVATW